MTHGVVLSSLRDGSITILSCNRQGEALATQNGHVGALTLVTLIAAGASCRSEGPRAIVVPSYDEFTSRLVQISADLNGDRRLDQWTYMDGNRPIRGEADTDGDGRIDRWEYFDSRAALTQIGTSSLNDGVEDTWISPAASNGESRVRRSRRRDRAIDWWEIQREGVLVRSEEDTNADGRPDKWDIFQDGVLREAEFDTTFSRGRADRRLVYGAQGQLMATEHDEDGDGRFERSAPATQATPGRR